MLRNALAINGFAVAERHDELGSDKNPAVTSDGACDKKHTVHLNMCYMTI